MEWRGDPVTNYKIGVTIRTSKEKYKNIGKFDVEKAGWFKIKVEFEFEQDFELFYFTTYDWDQRDIIIDHMLLTEKGKYEEFCDCRSCEKAAS